MRAQLLTIGVATLIAATSSAQSIDRELLVSGLSSPIWAGSPPGDHDRIFIAEQGGNVRILRNGALLPTPFHRQAVQSGGERGLLGFAFHPDFQANGYVYLSYSQTGSGASLITRYSVSSANPDVSDPSSGVTMLGPIAQPFSNHNGGHIEFGPDGFLYFGTGDGGSGGDPGCRAQNGTTLLGKMLRLDVDANPNGPAVAPASNPFVGNPSFDDLIWAYGLRNPWRFGFDRETGDLWIGDVGQNTLEEVNFQPGSSTGGENYGWKIKEGTNCFSTSGCANPVPCSSPTLVDPVRTLPTSSNCSVIGGYVYRGLAIPSLRGTYFHADYCSGRIYSMRFVGGMISDLRDRTTEVGGGGSLRSFGEDIDGEILYCAGSSLYRIVPVGTLPSTTAGAGSVGSNGETPVYEILGRFGAGNRLTLRLRGAPASSAAAILFGSTTNPVTLPFPGNGTLIPNPIAFSLNLATDVNGQATFEFAGDGDAVNLFHQAAIVDLGISGVTLSNALQTNFFFGPPPTITGVTPNSAPAGGAITISGTEFNPGLTLDVGGNAVTPSTITSSSIVFAYPANLPCDSMLTVTNPDGQSVSASINVSPSVTTSVNNSGPAAGGQNFIIVGRGFGPGTTVTFNGIAGIVTNASTSAIFVTTPPGAAGVANVVITTPGGCTTTTNYTYL